MKIFILYLFLLLPFLGLTVFFFADIEAAIDAKKFKESHQTNAEYQIFVEPTHDFKCPPSTPYFSDYNIHASFLQQAGQILSYGGVLFNVAIYGLRSVFSDTTTFLLDDISIFALSFTPIISWYFITKPLYIFAQVDQFVILVVFVISTIIIFLFIVVLLFIYNWPCHKLINNPVWIERSRNMFTKKRLDWIKYIIIHIYFLHAMSILYFNTIFTIIYFRNHPVSLFDNFVDFQLLNYLADFFYILLNMILIIELYKPRLIIRADRYREYRKFIHMKIFFFVVFLSSIELLFEFALICTPAYFDKIFNFIITTTLTRSASSFFCNDRNDILLCGSRVSLIYGKDEQENNCRKQYGIKVISNHPDECMDLHGVRILTETKMGIDCKITGTLIYAELKNNGFTDNTSSTFTINNKKIDINDGKIHSSYNEPFSITTDKINIMEGINCNGTIINTKAINININGKILRTIITNGRAQSFFIEGIPIKLTNDAKAINISGNDISEINIFDIYDPKKFDEIADVINNSKKSIDIKINGKSIKTIDITTGKTKDKIYCTAPITSDKIFKKDNDDINDDIYTIDIITFTKTDITDVPDVKRHDEIDITPVKIEIDNKTFDINDGTKNLENLDIKTIDIADGTIKLDITDGLGFLNYIIYAHRTRAPKNQKEP